MEEKIQVYIDNQLEVLTWAQVEHLLNLDTMNTKEIPTGSLVKVIALPKGPEMLVIGQSKHSTSLGGYKTLAVKEGVVCLSFDTNGGHHTTVIPTDLLEIVEPYSGEFPLSAG